MCKKGREGCASIDSFLVGFLDVQASHPSRRPTPLTSASFLPVLPLDSRHWPHITRTTVRPMIRACSQRTHIYKTKATLFESIFVWVLILAPAHVPSPPRHGPKFAHLCTSSPPKTRGKNKRLSKWSFF